MAQVIFSTISRQERFHGIRIKFVQRLKTATLDDRGQSRHRQLDMLGCVLLSLETSAEFVEIMLDVQHSPTAEHDLKVGRISKSRLYLFDERLDLGGLGFRDTFVRAAFGRSSPPSVVIELNVIGSVFLTPVTTELCHGCHVSPPA
jgi:hypothetical protein